MKDLHRQKIRFEKIFSSAGEIVWIEKIWAASLFCPLAFSVPVFKGRRFSKAGKRFEQSVWIPYRNAW
ncbi:hypothetical protein [Allobaculum sp. Allo2]|uniref:hypothetical protein n=1 Tax=Allobaculum sp. Allo2 TaxID=2853432 RepID=UPI001F60A04D|nr:hypothetical protein [Allobaculum sp. Allo2]UNT93900.1 hypothetical protein KWG61_04155 [Allobaculum sp. Allo2]